MSDLMPWEQNYSAPQADKPTDTSDLPWNQNYATPEGSADSNNQSETLAPLATPTANDDGAFWAGARSAARAILPGIAGTAAAIPSAALGAFAGPVGAAAAGVGGAVAGSTLAEKIQTGLADQIAPDSFLGSKQAEEDQANHPVASTLGGLLGFGRPSVKSAMGAGEALLTKGGRESLALAAKNSVPFTQASRDFAEAAAKNPAGVEAKAAERFSHVAGAAAGVGVGTAQGIAAGDSPLQAAGMGALGLGFEPWVGPHVFTGAGNGQGSTKKSKLDDLANQKVDSQQTPPAGDTTGTETNVEENADNTDVDKESLDNINDSINKADPATKDLANNLADNSSPQTAAAVIAAGTTSASTPASETTTDKTSVAPEVKAEPAATLQPGITFVPNAEGQVASTTTEPATAATTIASEPATETATPAPKVQVAQDPVAVAEQAGKTPMEFLQEKPVLALAENRPLMRSGLNVDKKENGKTISSLANIRDHAIQTNNPVLLAAVYHEITVRTAKTPNSNNSNFQFGVIRAYEQMTGEKPLLPADSQLKVKTTENGFPRVMKGGPGFDLSAYQRSVEAPVTPATEQTPAPKPAAEKTPEVTLPEEELENTEVPEGAFTDEEQPPTEEITTAKTAVSYTNEAQKLAEKQGINLADVQPNAQGTVTKREVAAHIKANPPEPTPVWHYETPEAKKFFENFDDLQKKSEEAKTPEEKQQFDDQLLSLKSKARQNPELYTRWNLNNPAVRSYDQAGVATGIAKLGGATWKNTNSQETGSMRLREVNLADGSTAFVDLDTLPEAVADSIAYPDQRNLSEISRRTGHTTKTLRTWESQGMPGDTEGAINWIEKHQRDKKIASQSKEGKKSAASLDATLGDSTATIGDTFVGENPTKLSTEKETYSDSIVNRAVAHMARTDIPLSDRLAVGRKLLQEIDNGTNNGFTDDHYKIISSALDKLQNNAFKATEKPAETENNEDKLKRLQEGHDAVRDTIEHLRSKGEDVTLKQVQDLGQQMVDEGILPPGAKKVLEKRNKERELSPEDLLDELDSIHQKSQRELDRTPQEKMSPEDYADYLEKLPEAERDEIPTNENSEGYNLWEARKLISKQKPNQTKFKKVSMDNSMELHNEFTHIANVDGEPYGLTNELEDPDDENAFVWGFRRIGDLNSDMVETPWGKGSEDEVVKMMQEDLQDHLQGESEIENQKTPESVEEPSKEKEEEAPKEDYQKSSDKADELLKEGYDAEQLMDRFHVNGEGRDPLRKFRTGTEHLENEEPPADQVTRGEPIQTMHAGDLLDRIQQDLRERDSKGGIKDRAALSFLRTIADVFAKNRARLEAIPTDIFHELEEGTAGEYDKQTKRISLPQDFDSETALHEIFHALTQGGGFHSAEIKRLFLKIRNEAVKRGLTSEEQWTRAANPDVLDKTADDEFHYAFSSHDEMIAGLLNPDIREALNAIPLRDEVTGKMSNAWEQLKQKFLQLLGFRVQSGSALDHYLTHVMELVKPSTGSGNKNYYSAQSNNTLDTKGGNSVVYANDYVKKDPYFGSRTSIIRGSQEGGQGALEQTPQIQRSAREVADRGSKVRDALLAVLADEKLVGRDLSKRTEAQVRQVSNALSRSLIAPEEELSLGKTTNEKRLAEAIRKFREVVPLVPSEEIDRLTQSEADSGLMLDQVQEMYENGALSDDKYAKVLNELARQNGIKLGNDLDAGAEMLRKHLENHQSSGAKWVLEGEGAESKAYKDDHGVVYKLSPIRQDVLGIDLINKGALNLTDRQPSLFDRDGRIPLFDRLIAANSMPGHSPTEIAGITTDGRIILKQPYLGREESETTNLVQAAIDSGLEILPTQKEDPRFGGDVNTTPIMFTIGGEPWLALDYNSRNARSVEGRSVPFDLVFKKLTAKEIAANKDLKIAADKLQKNTLNSIALRSVKFRKATTAGANDAEREIDPTRPAPFYNSSTNVETTQKMSDYINSVGTDAAYENLVKYAKDPTMARAHGYEENEVRNGLKQLQGQYQNKYTESLKNPSPTAEDLVNRRTAKSRNEELTDLNKIMGSAAGKATQEGANVDSVNKAPQDWVDEYLKSTLGGKLNELGAGKLNIRQLVDGIKAIKQSAAEMTIDGATKLLSKFGIVEPERLAQLKTILGDTDTTRADLKSVLAEMIGGNNPEKVEAATQQLTALYNTASQKLARVQLPKEVFASYAGNGTKGSASVSDKLGKYIGLGRFNEDQIHKTLLETIGITGYDADFVKAIRDEAARIQTLPKNSAPYNDALADFQGALGNEILSQQWKGSGVLGKVKIGLVKILPDLFRSAILTGPQTLLTHGFSGGLNVRLEAGFEALGRYQAALNEGRSASEAAGYFKDYFESMFGGDKGARGRPLGGEFWRALRTGKAAVGTSKGIGLRGSDALGSSNFGGSGIGGKVFRFYSKAMGVLPRTLLAFDTVNAGSGEELNQRWATRAALLNAGSNAEEVATEMKRIFAPSTEQLQPAYDKLAEEVSKGYFNGVTGFQKKALLAERLEQLHKSTRPLEALKQAEAGTKATEDWTMKGEQHGLWGALTGAIGSANRKTGVTGFVFPFTRIISALMNTSLSYTPLGLLRANNASLSNLFLPENSKYAWPKMVKGSPEQLALTSKSILGSSIGLAITTMFLKELSDEEQTGKKPAFMFYGAGPKDPAKRGEWMAAGGRPNTFAVGDTYLPYKAIPGINLLGTMLGTLHDYVTYENPLPKMKGGQMPTAEEIAKHNNWVSSDKAYRIATAIAMSPLEQHFLSGAKNLIDIMHDPQGASAPRAVVNQLVGTASQFTNPTVFRTVRALLGGIRQPEGNSPTLDTYNSLDGKAAQFIPFYAGFNTPSLNVLGDPIQKKPLDAITDRWLFSSTTAPDPIISPLVNNGLFLPGPKKNSPIMVNNQGKLATLNDAGDDAWRAYVVARGSFLKQVLSPSVVQQLINMDRIQAQSYLDGSDIGGAASHYARDMVEAMIQSGQIKVNG